ncbi:hypothetical protein QYE76_071809 [Lolium multiflorum]|uniref:Gag-pol polyprotein n=1 Tax=Lolium multiflorum TaxID=4521 RepID=A0AAD8WH65_LOLMU|nr:hypothetical protein QYE76_071809 [Lolium multiflorum]
METSPPSMTFKRDLVGPRLAAWNELLQRLASIQLVQGTDEFRWSLTKNGVFSRIGEIGENEPTFDPNAIFSPIGGGHAHKDAAYVGVDLNLAYFGSLRLQQESVTFDVEGSQASRNLFVRPHDGANFEDENNMFDEMLQRDNYYHNNRDKSKGDEVAQSPKDVTSSAGIVRNLATILMIVGSAEQGENGTYQPKNNDGNGKAAVVTGKGEAAVVAGNDGRDSSDGDCLAVLAACVSRDDEWILDTACSFHICCNKDWFSSYESVQSGDFVRVGNDNQCSIVGIGSVQIKTHDGMTRTLTGVKHIPSMARNLISLSTLDCDGYKYKGGNKLLKVSSGSLIIMIGDMNSAKLYVLRGSTLPGIAAAVSSDESSKTNLWHKRLGHMSELGMAELTKRELIDGCDFGKLEFCEHCIFETQTEKKVKILRTDNGMEFCSNEFDEFCSNDGMVEHAKENENVVPETNNDDNDVPPSPPFVQRQGRSIAADRPRRNIAPPTRLIQECDIVDYALSCAEQVEHDIEPATYTEAIASVDKEKWVGAMQEEMQSLEKNGTWDVVHLPKQKKAVRKWIFKRKEGLSPNEPPRFKARLVAKGFSQIPGVDYNDVFSPVVKHSSIRAFFGIVAMHDLELEQLDVKTAFLHGELEEEIYMDQPEGYVVPGKEDLVCKLKRSLYGLKQSPRQWYKSWKATLQDVVAQSTTEAEYMAIAEAVSQSAIYLTKDQMFHERTKHIDIKYHAIRDVVAKGKVKVIVEVHATRNLSQGGVCYIVIQIPRRG